MGFGKTRQERLPPESQPIWVHCAKNVQLEVVRGNHGRGRSVIRAQLRAVNQNSVSGSASESVRFRTRKSSDVAR